MDRWKDPGNPPKRDKAVIVRTGDYACGAGYWDGSKWMLLGAGEPRSVFGWVPWPR